MALAFRAAVKYLFVHRRVKMAEDPPAGDGERFCAQRKRTTTLWGRRGNFRREKN